VGSRQRDFALRGAAFVFIVMAIFAAALAGCNRGQAAAPRANSIAVSSSNPAVEASAGQEQDIVELHARESLLLDNYSWIDPAQGTVRIPIGRAMELIAARGLPVAPPVKTAPPMTGDHPPVVPSPLTGGFAPTAGEPLLHARQR
jgi:hypothetical protein